MTTRGWALLGNRVMGRQRRRGASRAPAQARSLTLVEGASGGVTTGHRGSAFSDTLSVATLETRMRAGTGRVSRIRNTDRLRAAVSGVRARSRRGHLASGIPPLPRTVGTKELLSASLRSSFPGPPPSLKFLF